MENTQSHSEFAGNLFQLSQACSPNDSLSNRAATLKVNPDSQQQTVEQFCDVPFQDHFLDCYGAVHIPRYQNGELFEKLAMKMTAVKNTNNKIKKRILREGYGSILQNLCLVNIFYNAYLNDNSKPFKRTSFTFRLNDKQTTPGLRIAVQTMKLCEISQFLVNSDYIGQMKEVPPNSIILYVIEARHLLQFIVCTVSEHSKANFPKIYKSALALCSKGNDLYRKGLLKEAIKEYNIAEAKLDECQVITDDDYTIQQKLLLRLRSNLVVAYTKMQEPRLTCLIYNRIHYMCRRIELNVPAKVYFNHARSLSFLSHYECAEKQLRRAQNLEGNNLVIAKELLKLDTKKKENYDREMALAKTTFKNVEITRELDDKDEITNEFKECLTEYCKTLSKDDETMLYNLPHRLTETELEFIKKKAFIHGLELKCTDACGVDLYIIVKPSEMACNNK